MNVTAVPLTEIGAERWDGFVEGHPHGWWWHRTAWIEYLTHYTGWTDYSSALRVGDRIVGVIPLLVKDGTAAAGDDPLAEPLYLREHATKCGLAALDYAAGILERYGRAYLSWRVRGMPDLGLPARPGLRFSRVIDVNLSPPRLWRDVRKSYKALIHQVQRRFEIVVGYAEAQMSDYAVVHRAAGGTRAARTYELQLEWVRSRHAFTAVAYEGSTPVAAAYVLAWKGWAYYASGPSLTPSAQHGLQWAIIEELAARTDVHYYEMGWQGAALDEKERQIEFFKCGFGGHDWPFEVREVTIERAAEPEAVVV